MLELAGKTVLATRPREQAAELQTLLEKRGANVLVQPTIEILPPNDFADVDDALRTLRGGGFDWTLFSSSNGVRYFLSRFAETLAEPPQRVFFDERQERVVDATRRAIFLRRDRAEFDAETFEERVAARSPVLDAREEAAFESLRRAAFDETRRSAQRRGDEIARLFRDAGTLVAAVGPGTANALGEFGIAVDLVPETEFNAEGLVAALQNAETELAGKRFLSVRASRGRDALSKELQKLGATVRDVVAYRSVDVETPEPKIVAALENGEIDYITVASSATAKAAAKLFGAAVAKTRWVALSSAVAETLKSLGASVAGVAEESTIPSLVDAVVAAETGRPFDGRRSRRDRPDFRPARPFVFPVGTRERV